MWLEPRFRKILFFLNSILNNSTRNLLYHFQQIEDHGTEVRTEADAPHRSLTKYQNKLFWINGFGLVRC